MMLTVLEAIQKSTEFLEKKGIESARLNAELLLAEILNCKRLDLYLRFEKPLSIDETNKYRDWITRRSKNEPLQYIMGYVEFYGLRFNVNPAVLIPRQETEILVEAVIEKNKKKQGMKILDIGTGSGIIPITLAKHLIDAEIIALDISGSALETAKENSILNQLDGSITFVEQDIFKANYSPGSFDLIISNPPYVSGKEYSTLQKEIIDYEPAESVTDKNDGLSFYRYIIDKGKDWLTTNGQLYFEVGKDQFEDVKKMMMDNNYKNISIVKDYQQIERVIGGEK